MGFYQNNFLLCPGFEKCGTTSLYAFLQGRKGICLPKEKETFFFNSANTPKESDYEQLFNPSPDEIKDPNIWYADFTPSYHRQPRTFERIVNSLNGKVIIIFLIRNPVKRAFSLYWHDLIRHITKGEKEANRFEEFRNCSFNHYLAQKNSYILSQYSTLLEKWISAFPDNVIIHCTEDIIDNPDLLIQDINEKSGLGLKTGNEYPRENEGWTASLSINPHGIRRHDQHGTKQIDLKRQHAINAMAMQGTFTHYVSQEQCEKIFNDVFAEDTKKCEDILDKELPFFKSQSDLVSPIVKSYT